MSNAIDNAMDRLQAAIASTERNTVLMATIFDEMIDARAPKPAALPLKPSWLTTIRKSVAAKLWSGADRV